MRESIILCEGYHDRAFWAGWLDHLGCTDRGRSQSKIARVAVYDPWGRKVAGGQFGFYSKTGKFVRIIPCHGDSRAVGRKARELLGDERQRIRQGASEPRLARLVFSVDPDVDSEDTSARTGFRQRDLHALVEEIDPEVVQTESGDLAMFNVAIVVSLIRWEAEREMVANLPTQQTLERLVCAALVAAYPDRGPAVKKWLDSRPDGPPPGPKEFAWSHMAGWYADAGCEGFYRAIWGRDQVVGELKSRLSLCGAWRVGEALAE